MKSLKAKFRKTDVSTVTHVRDCVKCVCVHAIMCVYVRMAESVSVYAWLYRMIYGRISQTWSQQHRAAC